MPEDTAMLLYTLGTTGIPKGAELTHFNVFFNAQFVRDNIFRINSDDVGLIVVPLFHPFGQTCMMNAGILACATLSLMTVFDVDKAFHVIQRDNVTFMAAVPAMFLRMVSDEYMSAPEFMSLRTALSGGSALSPDISEKFEERFGVRIMECYGLTETGSVASFNVSSQSAKPNSIGVPMWGCEIRIIREDGVFAGEGDVGEIVLRGANLMKGYYKKTSATEAAIVDGWFHTGDLARMNEDGHLSIVETKKDIIVRGGMNIYPREIEKILLSRSDVAEVCVIGVHDPTWGEEVRAYVALKKGASTSPDDLREFCGERMARYKTPRDVIILPSLPKGPTGKLLKRTLREMAQSE
jgi:long-chain acyl-CoA synthetase